MYQIIQKRKIWLGISLSLMAASVIMVAMWGLKLGIDFTGGSLLEVQFTSERPSVGDVSEALSGLELGSLITQPVGEDGIILRFQNNEASKHKEVLEKLEELATKDDLQKDKNTDAKNPVSGQVVELRYDSVGPSIGKELKRKAITALIIVIIAIILYIAWTFRHVSKPVASWKYGVAASLALFHDLIITVGVFALLGKLYNLEVGVAFVAALLTILGYSVNDTIVVFDRLRENLPKSDTDFENTVNASVNQTIGRSINTSLTVLFALLAIILFGGASIRDFVLALFIGISFGTYSSIFVASPILVIWENFSANRK